MANFIATAEIIGACEGNEMVPTITNHLGKIKTNTWIKSITINTDIDGFTYGDLTPMEIYDKNHLGQLGDDMIFQNALDQAISYFKDRKNFENDNLMGSNYTYIGFRLLEIKETNIPMSEITYSPVD